MAAAAFQRRHGRIVCNVKAFSTYGTGYRHRYDVRQRCVEVAKVVVAKETAAVAVAMDMVCGAHSLGSLCHRSIESTQHRGLVLACHVVADF